MLGLKEIVWYIFFPPLLFKRNLFIYPESNIGARQFSLFDQHAAWLHLDCWIE